MHPWLLNSPEIATYGVCLLAAVVIGWVWSRQRAKRAGVEPSRIDLMVPWLVGAGLAGAWLCGRLADAATGEEVHAMVLVGVLLLATMAGIGYGVAVGIPLGVLGDIFAAPAAAAIGVGRLGCFFAGCCYGKPCAGVWGVRFPAGSPAYVDQMTGGLLTWGAEKSLPVYPVQLLEAGLCGVLAVWLWRGMRGKIAGEHFLMLGAGYAVIRFGMEFLRGDNPAVGMGMTFSQWAGLGILAAVAGTWGMRRRFAGVWGLVHYQAMPSKLATDEHE